MGDEEVVRIPEIDPRPMRVEKVTPVSEIADKIKKAIEWVKDSPWYTGILDEDSYLAAVSPADISVLLSALADAERAGSLKNALEMTGSENEEDLIDMANVGNSLMNAIDSVIRCEGPFKNWSPADDPAEIVGDLYNHIEDQASLLEEARRVIGDCLTECDRSARPSYAWQLRARALITKLEVSSNAEA